jgi:cyclic pyranopterin phosphate synthase
VLKDAYKRDHTYLRLSVTDLCNFRCRYCLPPEGVARLDRAQILRPEEMVRLVEIFAGLGVRKVRITGGEPLLRRGLQVILEGLARIRPPLELALTTNGYFLSDWLDRLIAVGANKINISLDTLRPQRFRQITGFDGWQKVWDGIQLALAHPPIEKVKLNVVLQRGINDDEIRDFAKLTLRHPLDVRFIEMMPVGITPWHEGEWISAEEAIRRLPGIEDVGSDDGIAGPARLYRLAGAAGRIGSITGLSCPACSGCNRLRLTARGVLLRCLFDPAGLDLRDALRAGMPAARIACDLQAFLLGKQAIGLPKTTAREQGYSPCPLQVGG